MNQNENLKHCHDSTWSTNIRQNSEHMWHPKEQLNGNDCNDPFSNMPQTPRPQHQMDYMAPPLTPNPTNISQQRVFNPSQQLDNQSEQHALLGHHQEQQTYQSSNDPFAMPPKTPRSGPLQQQQQQDHDTYNIYQQSVPKPKPPSHSTTPLGSPHQPLKKNPHHSTNQQMFDSPYMSRSIESFDQQQPKPQQQQQNIHLTSPRMSWSLGPQQTLHQQNISSASNSPQANFNQINIPYNNYSQQSGINYPLIQ